jgi:CRP/FNR family transcriptional regulator, cyclic AMP receptor protein
MSASATLQDLVGIPLFRGLTEAEAARIVEIAEETSVKEGELIFFEGDPGDALFALLDGRVDVLKKDRTGENQQLAKLGKGAVLGEMSLIGGNTHRSATARAATDVRLLRISASRFGRLLRTDDVAALKVVLHLAEVMSRRLFLMDEKLVDTLDKARKRQELMDFQQILSNWSF